MKRATDEFEHAPTGLLSSRSGGVAAALAKIAEDCLLIQEIMAKFPHAIGTDRHQHWDEFIVTRLQRRIGIDIKDADIKATGMLGAQAFQRTEHVVAEMTIVSAIKSQQWLIYCHQSL